MLIRTTLLLIVVWSAASGCANGDKDSSQGQSDYLQRVTEILTALNVSGAEAKCESGVRATPEDCDRVTLAAAVGDAADSFTDLQPPAGFSAAHDRFAAYQYDLSLVLASPTEQAAEVSAGLSSFRARDEIVDEWYEGVEAHYRVRLFRNEGLSMAPTFLNGDTIALTQYEGGDIQRGAIVVYEFHLDPDRKFIKRVIGLPGDVVEIKDGAVLIDGEPFSEDYLLNVPNYTYGPKTVPAGHYFVLGDNRRNSFDSHAYALSCAPEERCEFVPEKNILGVLPPEANGEYLRD